MVVTAPAIVERRIVQPVDVVATHTSETPIYVTVAEATSMIDCLAISCDIILFLF